MIAKALTMDWGGVCFKTMYFLDIREASPRFAALAKEGSSFVGFKNIEQLSNHTYEENLSFCEGLNGIFRARPSLRPSWDALQKSGPVWLVIWKRWEQTWLSVTFSALRWSGKGWVRKS